MENCPALPGRNLISTCNCRVKSVSVGWIKISSRQTGSCNHHLSHFKIIRCVVKSVIATSTYFCWNTTEKVFFGRRNSGTQTFIPVSQTAWMRHWINNLTNVSIYSSSFTNVRFWTKIEFSNVAFHGKRSQNFCKMQVDVLRRCKLRNGNSFMAESWWGFKAFEKKIGLYISGRQINSLK